jgi:hypothetical protein
VNLALKGIVGLGAYSQLLNSSGDSAGAQKAWQQAQGFAGQWLSMGNDGRQWVLCVINLVSSSNKAMLPPEWAIA